MTISIEQLSKIRGLSLDELQTRGRQGLTKLGERFLRAHAAEMSDEDLFREFNPVWRDGTGEGTADLMRYRLRAKNRRFLPSLEQRRAIVQMMNRRFPEERDAIIQIAEDALVGRFSLLGHTDLNF